MPKTFFTSLGFILFITGMLSLVLMVVGIQFSFLSWIDAAGRGIGLIIRLAMVMAGVIMVVLAKGNFRGR